MHCVENIVTDLISALPGNSSVNTAQPATIEEAVFSADPTYTPIDCVDSDHVIRIYCRSMCVLLLNNESRGSKRIGAMNREEYKKSACEGFMYAAVQ
jgi:hypothetical protein